MVGLISSLSRRSMPRTGRSKSQLMRRPRGVSSQLARKRLRSHAVRRQLDNRWCSPRRIAGVWFTPQNSVERNNKPRRRARSGSLRIGSFLVASLKACTGGRSAFRFVFNLKRSRKGVARAGLHLAKSLFARYGIPFRLATSGSREVSSLLGAKTKK
jgi:hypothetical protein